MIVAMAKANIAVMLPSALVKHIQAAVRERRASSVSAYIAAAVKDRAKLEDLKVMLEKLLVEAGGPLKTRKRATAEATRRTTTRKKDKRRRK